MQSAHYDEQGQILVSLFELDHWPSNDCHNFIQLRRSCRQRWWCQRMNVSAREHILKMKLSFKVNTFPVYTLVTIFKFFYLAMCGWVISVINSLIVTLVNLQHYLAPKKWDNRDLLSFTYLMDLRYCTSAIKSISFAKDGCWRPYPKIWYSPWMG